MLPVAWRTRGLYAADAQEIADYLETLSEQNGGGITTELLVSDAGRRASPLRPLLEWQDSVAAEKYRKDQAKNIIKNLNVVRRGKRTKVRAFAFVHTPGSHAKQFVPVERAMGMQSIREQIVEQGVRELVSWIGRYGQLNEFRVVRSKVAALRTTIEAELWSAVGR